MADGIDNNNTGGGRLLDQTGSEDTLSKSIVIQRLLKDVEEVKKDITDYKTKIVETLALFIALFTFVSIEVQTFKFDIQFISIVGIALIMLGALLFFIFTLHFILRSSDKDYFVGKKILVVIIYLTCVALVGAGIWLCNKDYEQSQVNFLTRDEINQAISTSTMPLYNFLSCVKGGRFSPWQRANLLQN